MYVCVDAIYRDRISYRSYWSVCCVLSRDVLAIRYLGYSSIGAACMRAMRASCFIRLEWFPVPALKTQRNQYRAVLLGSVISVPVWAPRRQFAVIHVLTWVLYKLFVCVVCLLNFLPHFLPFLLSFLMLCLSLIYFFICLLPDLLLPEY